MQYLVAVDGSESSMAAVRYAVGQASATGAEVAAISVVVPDQFFTGGDDPPVSYTEAEDELVTEDIGDTDRPSAQMDCWHQLVALRNQSSVSAQNASRYSLSFAK